MRYSSFVIMIAHLFICMCRGNGGEILESGRMTLFLIHYETWPILILPSCLKRTVLKKSSVLQQVCGSCSLSEMSQLIFLYTTFDYMVFKNHQILYWYIWQAVSLVIWKGLQMANVCFGELVLLRAQLLCGSCSRHH